MQYSHFIYYWNLFENLWETKCYVMLFKTKLRPNSVSLEFEKVNKFFLIKPSKKQFKENRV